MTIEAKLEETNTLLRQLLTAFQSGAQIAAGDADNAPATRKRRTKAEIAADEAAAAAAAAQKTQPVVDGDPAGTVYWVSDEHRLVFAQPPGEPAPQGNEFTQVPAAEYQAKKAEFESAPPAAAVTPASGAQPTWDEAVNALKTLAQNPAHGSAAVMAVIKQIDPAAANVPALKDKGKNAEIVDAVNALLAPASDPLFG